MKKINKKGFTLVELLAVIVILGVLLLIAVPSVSNIIDKSKEKSFKSTAELLLENVEAVASVEKATGSIDRCLVQISDINLERGSKGSSPSGYITVDADGNGTINYTDGTYTATGTIGNISVAKEGKTIPNPNGYTSCSWYNS